MSTPNHPAAASAPTFTTAERLAAWLHSQGLDLNAWGQGGAKTVADLWHELQRGESTLQQRPLERQVRVVEVQIIRNQQILVEAEQYFDDGRVRVRNRPPSEKMHPDETPLLAAERCLQEELALAPSAISFPPHTIQRRTIHAPSDSYPTLMSRYTFYTLQAVVADLPDHSFTTPNRAHGTGDPIVAHSWRWEPTATHLQ